MTLQKYTSKLSLRVTQNNSSFQSYPIMALSLGWLPPQDRVVSDNSSNVIVTIIIIIYYIYIYNVYNILITCVRV